METRASYLIVGLFVIAGMLGLVFAAMWITGTRTDEALALYDIYFDGSVAGLKPGNAVQYRGIPVGGVIDMKIDPENVERVLVVIEVAADAPIREDTEATLALQGITGLSYIQLTGGTQEAAALKAAPGQRRPVIKSRPSELAAIFEAAPEMLNRAIEVIAMLEKLLGPENQQRIGNILQNIENTTGALSNSSGDIDKLLNDGAGAVEDVRKLTAVLAENTENIDSILVEGAGTMKDVHELTGTLAGSAEEAWGNAAIPGFGIGEPTAEPDLDAEANLERWRCLAERYRAEARDPEKIADRALLQVMAQRAGEIVGEIEQAMFRRPSGRSRVDMESGPS